MIALDSDLPPAPEATTGAIWQRLERLSEALAAADRTSPVPALLATARDGLGADAVFLDPGSGGEPVQVAGPPDLPADWCRQVLAVALAGVPGSAREFLRPEVPPLAGPVALVCLSRTRNIWLGAVRRAGGRPFAPTDLRLLSFVRRMYADHLNQEKAKDDLRAALLGLVHCLSDALDARDAYTAGHSERVARMAVRLAEQMRLPQPVRGDLYLAGLLHDVGKIGLADEVLRKPGPLTAAEFAEVQKHPVVGEAIVGRVKQLRHLRPGVRHHHERWDGGGYPDRLAGGEIPLLGRVLAVADAVDAMTSDRPYRPGMRPPKVEEILKAGAGVQWDPAVVGAFFGCAGDLYAICQRGLGESVAAAFDRGSAATVTSLQRSVLGGP